MPIAVATSVSPPATQTPLKPIAVSAASSPSSSWKAELASKGYVVVPSAISSASARSYVSRAHDWLEYFGLGYDRTKPETFDLSQLPVTYRGGLYKDYGLAHEQFLWDIRQEPGVIDAFAEVWSTKELLVSFDGANFSIPLPQNETNKDIFKPWPHVDQSPTRQFMHCVQGIVNLAPNGPNDGGLMVLKGSMQHFNELFARFDHEKPAEGWRTEDWFHHSPDMIKWLIEEKGCTWEKVCAGEGDLILWDSRTVHYGAVPLESTARMATYVCYKPASLMTPEDLARKQAAFETQTGTTHDPVSFRTIPGDKAPLRPDGTPDAAWLSGRNLPQKRAVLSDVGLRLAGVLPY